MLEHDGTKSKGWRMRVPISCAAVVAVASLGAIPLPAAQAATKEHAAAASSETINLGAKKGTARCNPGYFCLFEHANVSGRIVMLQGGAKRLSHFRFNDEASYVFNRTSHRWCLYENDNYKGAVVRFGPGAQDNLANGGGWWNDRASSAVKCDPRR